MSLASMHKITNENDFIFKNSPFLYQRKGVGGMD
jgi:hypothetical protein